MHPDAERLSRVALFADLTDDECEQLAEWFDVEEYDVGKHLAREGVSDYVFFALDRGTVRVEQQGSPIATLGPGDVFGEMAFLGDGHRQAEVVAVTAVRVFTMWGTRFREMQMSMPGVASRIEELARARAQEITAGSD